MQIINLLLIIIREGSNSIKVVNRLPFLPGSTLLYMSTRAPLLNVMMSIGSKTTSLSLASLGSKPFELKPEPQSQTPSLEPEPEACKDPSSQVSGSLYFHEPEPEPKPQKFNIR